MDTQIFEKRFNQYIEDNALIEAGQKILLTVSGGVDSMVMLNLFVRCGYNVGVAHCNFQLRGEESEEDEAMVLAEAEKKLAYEDDRNVTIAAYRKAKAEGTELPQLAPQWVLDMMK